MSDSKPTEVKKAAPKKSKIKPVLGCVAIVKNNTKKKIKIFASPRVQLLLEKGGQHIVEVTPWLIGSEERGDIVVLKQSGKKLNSRIALYEAFSPAPGDDEDEE